MQLNSASSAASVSPFPRNSRTHSRSHQSLRNFGLGSEVRGHDWLALSIGNSRLHWAWFAGQTLRHSWDTQHLDAFTIQRLIINQFNFHRCQLIQEPDLIPQWEDMPDLWIVSVVPHQTQFWQQYLRSHLIELSDIPLLSPYPTLGGDRAIAAWGAVQIARGAALVIDCGTALTLTGADRDARLVGGAILPGLQLQLRSLGQSTAALPTLDPQELQLPSRWATNTTDSISSGVLYSIASSLNSYIQDWMTRHPSSPIFITGGDTVFLHKLLREYLPHLAAQLRAEPNLAFLSIDELRRKQAIDRLKS